MAAVAVGMCERLLDEGVSYATERRQFNRPIAQFQLVQGMLADCAAEALAARSMVEAVARDYVDGRRITKQSACCKYFATEALGRIADRVVQIHGGYGYIKEYPVERLLPRRAAVPHLRGHQPDPAAHHRTRADQGARAMNALSRRALFAAPLLAALPARAQTYPAKSVRWIVPYAAGGPADALVRAIAPRLSEELGVPVIVDNRGGAGGSLAMEQLIKSPPDGGTIVLGGTGTHSLNPYIQANIPYDPIKDFAPVTPIVSYVNVLVVNADVPVKSVAELVAYAKANPNKVTFASGGTGTSNHLAAELLKSVAGAPMVHVPYRGSGPGMIDVISGHVASACSTSW